VLEDLGGLGKLMPFAGFAFGLGAFAAIGLPGFANFAGEIMIFFGAFRNGWEMERFHIFQITTVLALWGVVISAVYMLRAYRKAFMGAVNPDSVRRWKELVDLRRGLRVPVAMLAAALLWFGFYPQSFVQVIAPAFSSYFAANR
jgi:NADH-quinone oxidoreductase subunit M